MSLRASPILTVSASIIALLVLAPIALLIFGMFWSTSPGLPGEFTLEHIGPGLDFAENLDLISNTFVFALGSTIVSMSIAVCLALILQRTNTPGRRFFDAVVLVQFVLPSFLGDIAWTFLGSPKIGLVNYAFMAVFGLESPPFNIYSQGGMIWSQGLALAALAYLLIQPAFYNMDPSYEEGARISGASIRTSLRKVTLPILYPSIITTSLLLFMISLRSFETPTFLGLPGGIRVYMSAIYENTHLAIPAKYGVATTQATAFLVVMLIVLIFYLKTTSRLKKFVAITGKGYRPSVIDLGKWRFATMAFSMSYLGLAIFLPFAMIVFISFLPFYTATQNPIPLLTTENYLEVINSKLMIEAAWNSTYIATLSAFVGTVGATLLSYMALRTRLVGRRFFEMIGNLPLGYPGLVFGLALLWTFLTFFRQIHGTPYALVIAYLVIFMPVAMRSIANSLIQLSTELEEAGQVAGASWLRTIRAITIPLMKPALINTFILVFLNSYRELGTAVLLAGPGMFVMPVIILFYWNIAWFPTVAAATTLYGGGMMSVLIITRFLLRNQTK